MTQFDSYLIVDWGASSKPKTGRDSVWYCFMTRTGKASYHTKIANPETRWEAVRRICCLLHRNVAQGLVTLVGFDFPYGYPAGTAAALGLKKAMAWRSVWDVLCKEIDDNQDNSNNRFLVAAKLNWRMSGGPNPYWGCPESQKASMLTVTKSSQKARIHLADKRLTEQRAKGAQSAWKLWGPGSVGSQALLGIPYVARLRDDPCLASVSRVWPFETGIRELPERAKRSWLILHAEVFPSIIKVAQREDEVKDCAQVRSLATYLAQLDEEESLPKAFAGSPRFSKKDRRVVETEEGWILGVT